MSEALHYSKRLIEVDLPIKRISAHARREKSIRHGHISTLHIWWARRPLAACRAVICAALWPDPADDLCPESFREVARREMRTWAGTHISLLGEESYKRFNTYAKNPRKLDELDELRNALLDFIADFSNWDNSTDPAFLATSRALTQAAHEALGGAPGTRPLVVDPFAGGGAIPLEALRVGADAFASDLNPVPVLLNKVVLEYVPKYGQRLADEVRKWGGWIKQKAERELGDLYPRDTDGATPIAYLWARTIQCEGPACGVEVPLIRSLLVAKKSKRRVALQMQPDPMAKAILLTVGEAGDSNGGTVRLGAVTCPICHFTTHVERVRAQLRVRQGGAWDSRLLCRVVTVPGQIGRIYRTATDADESIVEQARHQVQSLRGREHDPLPAVPYEETPPDGTGGLGGGYRTRKYGITEFGQFFNPRQLVTLTTLSRLAAEVAERSASEHGDSDLARATATCLGLAVSRQVDYTSSLCSWHVPGEKINHTFGRQALSMVWDYAEVNPFSGASGDFGGALAWVGGVIEHNARLGSRTGSVEQTSATNHTLPDNCADAFVTDPPYYDSVPYGELSDFFYVWLRRILRSVHPKLFDSPLVDVSDECIVNMAGSPDRGARKSRAFFETAMKAALTEGRRVTRPGGIGTVVFAHKSTAGWETQLEAIIDSGWVITASWPIDTEMGSRLRAQNSAVLASSVHLVCRPRESADGSVRTGEAGDWRDVLAELPRRIHEWMPRLAEEGVVGADAIFACLGPALEVFSRYSRVERVNGELVTLREYLEQVWAAVSREALSMIFADPETAGLDEDARVTAMWLWTIAAPLGSAADNGGPEEDGTESDDNEDVRAAAGLVGLGFTLEFDAARKIAQGLGARLEALTNVVEVKGDKARLLSVAERTKYLFGGPDGAPAEKKRLKKKPQRALFEELEEVAEQQGWGEVGTPRAGSTTLDRVHQAMILFGAGRGEAMKRFLVDEGVGRGAQFWKLAQALSALYPTGTDEKRWVDGVLARKKGLGF